MTAATSVALAACIFVNSQVLCLLLTPSLDTGQSLPGAVHTTCTSKSFFSALAQVQVCAVVVQAHKLMLRALQTSLRGTRVTAAWRAQCRRLLEASRQHQSRSSVDAGGLSVSTEQLIHERPVDMGETLMRPAIQKYNCVF